MTAWDHFMFTLALLGVLSFFGFAVVYVIHLMNNALKDFKESQREIDNNEP